MEEQGTWGLVSWSQIFKVQHLAVRRGSSGWGGRDQFSGRSTQQESSLQGDSGGPLVYQTGNGWILIGIVSWGTSNCNINTPAMYTRVSQFRNWIDAVVAQG